MAVGPLLDKTDLDSKEEVNAGWGKSRFAVVCMKNNTRINSVFHVVTSVNLLFEKTFFLKRGEGREKGRETSM